MPQRFPRPLALLLLLAIASGLLTCGSPEPPPPRGVILISLDNLAASHMSLYGYERPTTPNLDAFMGEGCVFETCISATNWTLPGHMSMLTGARPRRHGLVNHNRRGSKVDMIPTILHEEGIATGAFTHHTNVSREMGYDRGFDHFFEYLKVTDEKQQQIDPRPVLANAHEWIEAQGGAPFFAFVHLFTIHWPHVPGLYLGEEYEPIFDKEYDGTVTGARVDVDRLMVERRSDRDETDLAHLEALYDEDVYYVDRLLNDFLQRLEKQVGLDDVLIIVTSDHGEAFKEHDYYGHGVSFHHHELNVPLAMRWPARIEPARIGGPPMTTLDIAPTILEAFGASVPDSVDGIDLTPIARGEMPAPERTLLSESSLEVGSMRFDRFAILNDGFKYMWLPTVKRFEKQHQECLFDMTKDPGETHDLSVEKPQLVEKFRKLARQRFGYRDVDHFVLAFGPSEEIRQGTLAMNGGILGRETLRLTTIENPDAEGFMPDFIYTPRDEDLKEKVPTDAHDRNPLAYLSRIPFTVTASPEGHALFFRPSDENEALRVVGDYEIEALLEDGSRQTLGDDGIRIAQLDEQPLTKAYSLRSGEVVLYRTKIPVYPDRAEGTLLDLSEEQRRVLEQTGYIDGAMDPGDR